MSNSEKRAIKLNARAKAIGLAQAAKEIGIPFMAARRIMERYSNREYVFQKTMPWAGWCVSEVQK